MTNKVQFSRMYLYRRVVQAKLFIDANYAEPVNLDAVADTALFSKFHFIRLFKSIYGKTPHQYLIKVRVEHARLLLAGGTAVADACYAVGFDSTPSFASLFRRVVGQTPSAYRQNCLERKADIQQRPLVYIPNCFAEKKGWVS